jgi:hypothetical protein
MVLNNFAVAKAEFGSVDEAIYLLNLLLKEKFCRTEIVYFNLAQINMRLGKNKEANHLLLKSYEVDKSLYRVRKPYIDSLDRLISKYKNIEIIDMVSSMPDHFYLDHCHLLPEGQHVLAEKIQIALKKYLSNEKSSSTISNVLYNPELGIGNTKSFHEYFNTYANYSINQIVAEVAELRNKVDANEYGENELLSNLRSNDEILNALRYSLKHPCFSTVRDVLNAPLMYPSDIGRFPEYFILRFLIPYVRLHESKPHLYNRFNPELGLIHSSKKMKSILPENTIVSVSDVSPNLSSGDAAERILLTLDKVGELLSAHLEKGNQIFERTKATIYWYVRESLRFGSHSRISMLYDRVSLEYIAEGLLYAGVLDDSIGGINTVKIKSFIEFVEQVTKIHESYCAAFVAGKGRNKLIIQYDEALKNSVLELNYITAKSL